MIKTDKIILPAYNPCQEYICFLKESLKDCKKQGKKVVIKYDNELFFTNIKTTEMLSSTAKSNINYFFSDSELLIIKPEESFFTSYIKKCPEVKDVLTGDIYLDGILKRMYSQMEFGYYKDDEVSDDSLEICYNIFKAIYTKSKKIKLKSIEDAVKEYNRMQKDGFVNKSVINGIIYSVCDYYNFLL